MDAKDHNGQAVVVGDYVDDARGVMSQPKSGKVMAIFDDNNTTILVVEVSSEGKRYEDTWDASNTRKQEQQIPRIHTFDSSGEAYDACQCDDDIKNGDVLVIAKEKVVGVADTWPIAITAENGALHQLNIGVTAEGWAKGAAAKLAGFKAAQAEARRLGFPLDGEAEPAAIKVHVEAVDGFKTTHLCKNLTEARKAAQEHVGATPDIGSGYAVSADGVVKVTADGASLRDLFPRNVVDL